MRMPDDPFNLGRFLAAQDGVYEEALVEIGSGRKRSHWMWFVFPQLAGLGSSETSRHFAIQSVAEARAYLDHSVLGPRLTGAAGAALSVEGRTAREIFGAPDDMKLLDRFFDGEPDRRTLELLAS